MHRCYLPEVIASFFHVRPVSSSSFVRYMRNKRHYYAETRDTLARNQWQSCTYAMWFLDTSIRIEERDKKQEEGEERFACREIVMQRVLHGLNMYRWNFIETRPFTTETKREKEFRKSETNKFQIKNLQIFNINVKRDEEILKNITRSCLKSKELQTNLHINIIDACDFSAIHSQFPQQFTRGCSGLIKVSILEFDSSD